MEFGWNLFNFFLNFHCKLFFRDWKLLRSYFFIFQVMKTIDKKNIYKVADAPQIMICSHDLQSVTTNSHSDETANLKRDKIYQWPHGRKSLFSISRFFEKNDLRIFCFLFSWEQIKAKVHLLCAGCSAVCFHLQCGSNNVQFSDATDEKCSSTSFSKNKKKEIYGCT